MKVLVRILDFTSWSFSYVQVQRSQSKKGTGYFSAAQDSQSFFNAGNQSFFCPLSFNFLPLFFEGRQIWGFHFAMRNVCIGPQSIYIRTVRTLQNWFKLVYGPFGQSNMHHTLDLCPNQAARKESNVPKLE